MFEPDVELEIVYCPMCGDALILPKNFGSFTHLCKTVPDTVIKNEGVSNV